MNLLSKASNAAEAQAALTAPPSAKPQPKTFPHAIARAALAGSQDIATATPQGSTEPDPLSQGLEKFAIAQEKVGEARLDQDEKIQSRFLAGWSTTLNQGLKSADKSRTAVQNARLALDAAKSRAGAGGKHEESYTEAQRAAIEQAEDTFVEKVDEATSVMRNVLDTPEPLRNLSELVRAQAEEVAEAAGAVAGVEMEQGATAEEGAVLRLDGLAFDEVVQGGRAPRQRGQGPAKRLRRRPRGGQRRGRGRGRGRRIRQRSHASPPSRMARAFGFASLPASPGGPTQEGQPTVQEQALRAWRAASRTGRWLS